MRRVTVIIPALNEACHLPGLLTTLAMQTVRPMEVIVMDGGSTDGSPEVIRDWVSTHPDLPVRLINNLSRHIPHALNLGAKEACGDTLVILGGHCEPQLDFVESCLLAMEESGAAMVGGALDVKPGSATAIAEAIALAVTSPLGAGDAAYRVGTQKAKEVDTIPFGCFAKSLWEELGGYNEKLLTNEDYEFAVRVRANGGRIWFDPRIRCRYSARATLRELAHQYWRYGWWKVRMLRLYPRSLRWRQAVPIVWSGAVVGLLMGALIWYPLAMLYGLIWLVYLITLFIYTVRTAPWRWEVWPPLLAAFVTIHFSWGWGAWASAFLAAAQRHQTDASPQVA